MAEAHQAVAFSFQITHEGWDVNFDREVLNLVWQSGIRSWKKRFARFMNSVHNGVYPAHLWTLWITMSIVAAIHFSGYKVPYDLVTKIMPLLPGSSTKWQLVGSAIVATLMWLTVIYMIRYALKLLLMYKGWMYEQRGKGARISTQTKVWVILVRILSGWNKPKLYSFQGSIPKLPLPSLHDTMARYMKSVRPLLDDENYDKMAKLAAEFKNGIGVKLQRYLILKSWWSSNYVSDWWEEYVYLRGRSPLMINSNFYGIDAMMMQTTNIQAARAAALIHSFLGYRRLVERQELEPILAQSCVPLCSWQYERIFNTNRIPGVETDKIAHWPDSNHIVVYHKGRYFKVIIYRGRIMKPRELQVQIQQILDDTSDPQPGEEKLAALTAGNRTEWANIRRTLFNKGTNKASLDTIEKAAFVVALDNFPYTYDPKDPSQLDKCGKTFLHGKGYDRWFDKSFTLCIGSNGKNNVHNGVYPARLWTLWFTMAIVMAIHYSGYKVPYDLVTKIMPFLPGTNLKWQLIGSGIVASLTWLTVIYTIRYTLKLLFMYKGWMFEARGKGISTKTKIWIVLVRVLSAWNKPKLYSLQGSIPKLPLPSLNSTLSRYMLSIRPLVDDENYERIKRLAKDFEDGIGVKLQRYLILKSWWASNYVSDWWEEYVYLRGRSPLMICSNFYGMDAHAKQPTSNQAARAGSVICACIRFRRLIDRQELKPLMIQGCVPLCSSQYERVFNTSRVPGVETDQIVHWRDSSHIVVYHRGRYFKVIFKKGRILNSREIQEQIQQILDDKSQPQPGEEKLAALTAGNRSEWATIRRNLFNRGVNKVSLDTIEKAAFFVSLDDIPYISDTKNTSEFDKYGKTLLHGNGYDKWFDKSFTLCIGSNGKMGVNCEHTWGDAPISTQVWEYIITEEIETKFAENGDVIGKIETTPPPPVRLQWDIGPDGIDCIEQAAQKAQKLIDDLDLRIYFHDHYGKGFIKTCKVSPDAYIQMALQLAYYRDAGKFCLTYEACMTRLYREGRTETVRSCTVESAAWVNAMENKNSTREEKIELLKRACDKHQRSYLDAMCGKGVDRHLFCLYVVSKYLDVESPFLQEVLGEPWRLSTSQSPIGQTGIDFKKYPECIGAGGGFGPVVDDGYGISYIVAGEDTIFFHISNKKSSKVTGYDGLDMHENFTPDFINIGQYATDLFTERATKLINEHEYVSNPLFLFISHLAPHTGELNITTGDTFLEERNSDEMNEKFGYIGDINRRRYVDIVKSADDSLGEIMKALLDKGVMDNTMILFMSDNGGQTFGMHENFASNWPLRGVPYIYEGIYDGYYGVTGRESENPVYNISAVLLSPTNEALSYYRDCRNTLPTDLSCSPCLFDLKNDPCESGNIAEEESDIVNYLSYKVDQFWNELVPQQNKPFDVNSDPAKFGYVWSPWLDDVPEKRIQLIHSNYKIYV